MNRDELISAHLPLASLITKSIFAQQRIPRDEFEDAYQDAQLGLLKAIDAYNPAAGPLKPYIRLRVTGEIIDGLRLRTGVRNQVRTRPATLSLDLVDRPDYQDHLIDPVDHFGAVENLLAVQAVLNNITREQRDLLLEHYCNRKPVSHMAVERGIPRHVVERNLKEAMAQARRIFGIKNWRIMKNQRLP